MNPLLTPNLHRIDAFWEGCKSCVNYETLMSKERKIACARPCYTIQKIITSRKKQKNSLKRIKGFERLLRFKQWKLFKKKDNNVNSGGSGNSKIKSFLFHYFNF